nr:MAG TPA: hypothetical protein [Caudoviricetes sp.]
MSYIEKNREKKKNAFFSFHTRMKHRWLTPFLCGRHLSLKIAHAV